MPPKFKFTREQIIDAGVNVIRKNGADGLTARALAFELGSSAKPIFGLFENMDEVYLEVVKSANKLYQTYVENGMSDNTYPAYKASGIAYIKFAQDEKELFKLLFMRDRSGENIEDGKNEPRPILELIMKNLGISEDEAFKFHLENWVYVHGIATMIATNYLNWDTDFISKSLSDVYNGLKHRYLGGK